MAANPPITAVGFSNDNIASGALVETQRLGISVPKRLSLIGFGDFPMGRMLSPSLSTLTPPRGEIGQATAQAVLHALANKVVAKDVLLPWHLQERASTNFVLSN
jgi:LacI family gluconate utilization system Gnt-I transcriptional repressor